ncbi:hypothetical protein D3C77_530770 [compost metagenome]
MGVLAVLGTDLPGLVEVMSEHGFDLVGEVPVDRQQHHFEVQAERAVVQIGAADGADLIVDQHHLLVQEPRTITEHSHPCSNSLESKKAGGGIDDAMVGTRRHQDAHIHPT